MREFLSIILSLPTVVFTVPLALALLYWIMVMVGALDLDLFDLDADLDLDVDADVDLDVDVDGGLDGVDGALVAALNALGLVGVPLTVSLSVLVFLGWGLSFLGSYYGAQALGAALGVGAGIGIALGSGVLGLLGTSILVRPLRAVFTSQAAHQGAASLLGITVRVSSGSVSATSGRAEVVKPDGTTLTLSIRCDGPNHLKRGDQALLISFDEARHVYQVEPMHAMMDAPSRDVALDFDALERAERAQTVPEPQEHSS